MNAREKHRKAKDYDQFCGNRAKRAWEENMRNPTDKTVKDYEDAVHAYYDSGARYYDIDREINGDVE